jgi:hypothetical protein
MQMEKIRLPFCTSYIFHSKKRAIDKQYPPGDFGGASNHYIPAIVLAFRVRL